MPASLPAPAGWRPSARLATLHKCKPSKRRWAQVLAHLSPFSLTTALGTTAMQSTYPRIDRQRSFAPRPAPYGAAQHSATHARYLRDLASLERLWTALTRGAA